MTATVEVATVEVTATGELSPAEQTATPTETVPATAEMTTTATVTPAIELTTTATITPATEVTATATITAAIEVTVTSPVTPATGMTATIPLTPTAEVTATAAVTPTAGDNIVAMLQAQGLNEFVAALQTTGLIQTLSGEGPFTVFAPTNEAFAAVPAATREDAAAMALIVQRHIIVDQVLAADLASLGTALTIQGDTLTLTTADDGTLTVEAARVVQPDIQAANGIIHVIDAVLLPPSP
jgi:uncharacterized surface protein with fasciclin (FAS1) repeats